MYVVSIAIACCAIAVFILQGCGSSGSSTTTTTTMGDACCTCTCEDSSISWNESLGDVYVCGAGTMNVCGIDPIVYCHVHRSNANFSCITLGYDDCEVMLHTVQCPSPNWYPDPALSDGMCKYNHATSKCEPQAGYRCVTDKTIATPYHGMCSGTSFAKEARQFNSTVTV